MPLEKDIVVDLMMKHLSGTLTAAEQQQLLDWAAASEENALLLSEFEDEAVVKQQLADIYLSKNNIWDHLQAYTQAEVPEITPRRFNYWYAAAAAAALLLSGSIFLLSHRKYPPALPVAINTTSPAADIPTPATTKAYITLSNGKKVYIDSIQTGGMIMPGTTTAHKVAADIISYSNQNANVAELNTITVPRGSRPLVISLPDGSRLSVNVASTVSFKAPFDAGQRLVTVSGEAFFDIAPATTPFIVKTAKGEEIRVLGTSFNLKSYEDESTTKTTLVTGKIQFNQINTGTMKVLTAGQQAVAANGQLFIQQDADIEEALAWKNNVFQFRNEELKSIMKQLGRWYDVEVTYEGTIPPRFFTTNISRDKSLTAVLKIMELYGIHFRLEGKKLTVLP